MATLFWIFFALVFTSAVGLVAMAAAICVFGAAAHGFFLTIWRGILHRGGAAAVQGPDEPAFRAYYRSQVWRDLTSAVATAGKRAGEETKRIQALVPQGDDWYLVLFRVVLAVYAYVGLAIGALLGAIAGIVPTLLIALVAGGAWAIGAPMRGFERLRRQRDGKHFDCPECRDRFALAVYVCPNCSAKHRRLAPGPFGVLRHRCTCAARLPALQLLGRERLTSECPKHGHALGEGVGTVRTFHVPVAGGPSSGKSTFLAAAMLGLEQAAAAGTMSTTVQSSSRDGYDRLLDGFRHGVLPAKTVNRQAPSLVAEVRGQDASVLLYAYDVAGEAYGDEQELRRDAGYGLADGVVLLIDPFALERVRGELGDELAAGPPLRPSTEPPQRVIERLVGVLGEKGVDMSRIPAAICVTKCDGLGIGDAINRSPGADEDARVRAWLDAQGGGNLLRSVQSTFREIRCFSASALGRTPGTGDGPFTSSGTLEPLLWLLARAGVEPAAAGAAKETQTQRLTSAKPLDVGPRRPLFTGAINAITPWPLAANFALGLCSFGALSLASTPVMMLGSGSSGKSSVAAITPSAVGEPDANPPPPSPPPPNRSIADNRSSPPPGGSPSSPSRVLSRHFRRLGSGDYDGAFALMSSRYHAANPGWTNQRRDAQPWIDIEQVGPSRVDARVAFVYVKFYARDRNDTPESDTRCRRFEGRVRLLKEGSSWRYDPRTGQLSGVPLRSSLDVCTS